MTDSELKDRLTHIENHIDSVGTRIINNVCGTGTIILIWIILFTTCNMSIRIQNLENKLTTQTIVEKVEK